MFRRYLALLLRYSVADLGVHHTTFFVHLGLTDLLMHSVALLLDLTLPVLGGGADILRLHLALLLLAHLALLLSVAFLLLDDLSDQFRRVHTAHLRNILAFLFSNLGTLLLRLLLGGAFLRENVSEIRPGSFTQDPGYLCCGGPTLLGESDLLLGLGLHLTLTDRNLLAHRDYGVHTTLLRDLGRWLL